jgi:hypothetical protein
MCTISADGETPSVEGDLLDLTDIASSGLSFMDLPVDFPLAHWLRCTPPLVKG